MKYCMHCGKELPDEAMFCLICGKNLNGQANVNKKQESFYVDVTKSSNIVMHFTVKANEPLLSELKNLFDESLKSTRKEKYYRKFSIWLNKGLKYGRIRVNHRYANLFFETFREMLLGKGFNMKVDTQGSDQYRTYISYIVTR